MRGPGEPERLDEWRRRLYEARAERVWPGLDDKRLTSWNALMISALAEAGAVLERDDYLDAARAAADFVLRELRDADGRLLRTWKDGARQAERLPRGPRLPARGPARRSTRRRSSRAGSAPPATLADTMIERFADDERGGFFETSSDHERLVARRKDLEDHPIPSGNSSAAYGLLRLAALTGEHDYEDRAVGVSCGCCTRSRPSTRRRSRHLLQALDFHLATVRRWRWSGRTLRPLERVVRDAFRPHLVLAGGEPDGVPLLEGREPVDGRADRLRVRALRLPRAGDRAG